MLSEVTCPHCGQRMLRRLGVQLSPRLADIFDVIQRRQAGVDIEILLSMFYPDTNKRSALNTLKAHIWLLNERLAETDFRVRNIAHKGGRYALRREIA